MSTDVRVPDLPESVAEARVLTWHKQSGTEVKRGENLVDLETDKVVLEVPAPTDGVLAEILVNEGDEVGAQAVLAQIEAGRAAAPEPEPEPEPTGEGSQAPAPSPPPSSPPSSSPAPSSPPQPGGQAPALAPGARRLVKEMQLDPDAIVGTGRGGRIHKADVIAYLDRRERDQPDMDAEAVPAPTPEPTSDAGRPEQRVPMTRLRERIAERLVQAQQTAAILTTFNEVNLQAVTNLRRQYRERFEQTHGVRLGLMSFFVRATVEALQRFPVVNASVDGKDIIYHGYYDIGIAVSSPRGLVVPILRNCDQLSMAAIEQGIAEFGGKAKDGTLSYEELSGGTFSITNGGVFGSLLSTPILNPPQSAILGMHKVEERPVVEDGAVVVRPMMYLALSYDHRLIDGRDAVQFLVTVKEAVEDPARLLLGV